MRTPAYLTLMVILLTACTTTAPPAPSPPPGAPRASPLADAVNAYRAQNGLGRIARSAQLDRVAAAHAADLERNYRKSARCNMHSWSANGAWTPCCYTEDHAQKECMWHKPKEITGGVYTATGYEIVAWHSEPITPARALTIWQGSHGHHIMVLNRGQWSDNTWRALGSAQTEHYAVIWFGEESDPTR